MKDGKISPDHEWRGRNAEDADLGSVGTDQHVGVELSSAPGSISVRASNSLKSLNSQLANTNIYHMMDAVRFYFTRSARRHKIGKAHALVAIANAGAPVVEGSQVEWVGLDDRGLELHIVGKIADENPNRIVIRHVMPTDLR